MVGLVPVPLQLYMCCFALNEIFSNQSSLQRKKTSIMFLSGDWYISKFKSLNHLI